MNVAIIGSRSFNDYDTFKNAINKLNLNISKIISGGANGADKLSELYAKEYDIPIIIHYPNWQLHGKSAGFIRNKRIINDSDIIIAFWDLKSKGTKHSIDIAYKQQKQTYIFNTI